MDEVLRATILGDFPDVEPAAKRRAATRSPKRRQRA